MSHSSFINNWKRRVTQRYFLIKQKNKKKKNGANGGIMKQEV